MGTSLFAIAAIVALFLGLIAPPVVGSEPGRPSGDPGSPRPPDERSGEPASRDATGR